MNERKEIRERLLTAIERDSRLEKVNYLFIVNRWSNRISETKYMRKLSKIDHLIPEKVIFKAGKKHRIVTSILFVCILIYLLLKGSKHGFSTDYMVMIIFFSVLFSGIAIYLWIAPQYRNSIILDKNGITFNSITFQWRDIVTTHIQYNNYAGRMFDNYSYLILGLITEKIEVFDISLINFGSNMWDRADIFGHYIEVFKIRYESENIESKEK